MRRLLHERLRNKILRKRSIEKQNDMLIKIKGIEAKLEFLVDKAKGINSFK